MALKPFFAFLQLALFLAQLFFPFFELLFLRFGRGILLFELFNLSFQLIVPIISRQLSRNNTRGWLSDRANVIWGTRQSLFNHELLHLNNFRMLKELHNRLPLLLVIFKHTVYDTP